MLKNKSFNGTVINTVHSRIDYNDIPNPTNIII